MVRLVGAGLATLSLGLFLGSKGPRQALNPGLELCRDTANGPEIFEPTLVGPGTRETRALDFGQCHLYALELKAGEAVWVGVEQQGVDLEVTLWGPELRRLQRVDSPNGPEGPETLAWFTERTGRYWLRLRTPEVDTAGTYQLQLEARPGSLEDWVAVQAASSFAAAERAEAAGELDEATRQYQRAGDGWHRLDRALELARCERRLGKLAYRDGQVAAAVAHFERALPTVLNQSNAYEQMPLLNEAGLAYRLAGESEKALEVFQQALTLAEATDHRTMLAGVLNNLGILQSFLGESRQAIELHQRALALRHELGDRSGEARTLHNLGTTYSSMGRPEDGREYLGWAMELRDPEAERGSQARSLSAIGWTHALEGDLEGAIRRYQEAVEEHRAAGDHRGAGGTLDLLGAAYLRLGQPQRALESLLEARRLLESDASRPSEAYVLSNLGRAYEQFGELETAERHHRDAIDAFQAMGDFNGEAMARVALASTLSRGGALGPAQQQIETALDRVETVRAQLQSGAFRSTYAASRWSVWEAYIQVLMAQHQKLPLAGFAQQAFEASERARSRSLLERLGADPRLDAGAQQELAQKINRRERHRASLLDRVEATEAVRQLDRELATLLLEFHRLDENPPNSATSQGPEALSLAEIQTTLLDADTALLVYHLGDHESYLWWVQSTDFATWVLPPRKEIEGLARMAYALWPRSQQPGKRRQTEGVLQALSDRILGPLGERLDGPRRLAIVADGALRSLPIAALPLPTSGDPQASGEPLITRFETVSLLSASVLSRLRSRDQQRPTDRRQLAVVADPVFARHDPRLQPEAQPLANSLGLQPRNQRDLKRSAIDFGVEEFARLPFSADEATAILSLVPEEDRWVAVGFEANRETVLGGTLEPFRYVHFATHGLLNDRHPGLSGLVLSLVGPQGAPRDGLLRQYEIPELRLSADLVTLSACRTVLGHDVTGEGLINLPRSFFAAGATRVLVTAWSVDDRATSVLMPHFYRGLFEEGLTASSALRQAQLALRAEAEWEAPVFWAAFSLHGDWR